MRGKVRFMISTGSLAAFSASAIPSLQRPGPTGLQPLPVASRRPTETGASATTAPGTAPLPLTQPSRTTPRGSLLDLSV